MTPTGTIAFLRSISVEAIGLGVHLAAGTHEIFMQAEYILANIPPSVPWPSESKVNSNVRSNQPSDARQGIRQVGSRLLGFHIPLEFILMFASDYGIMESHNKPVLLTSLFVPV